MLEELKQLLRQFSLKGWLLYYAEKRKNAKNGGSIQQAPHPLQESLLKQGSMQPRDIEEYDSQSDPHAIPKPNDSRATDNNSRAKGESIKRGRQGMATRNIN